MNIYSKPMVMIDFETSGMSPAEGGRVTEVAALRIVDNCVVDRYVSLINCRVQIPRFITELTGITQAMVNSAPSCNTVIPELLDFIGTDTLAAHNASFDEGFLLAESQRLGLQPRHQGVICTVKLTRRVFPGHASYKLGEIAKTLGIRFSSAAHRAEADAEVAAEVVLRVGKLLTERHNLAQIDPALLIAINRVAAAKVESFLKKQAAALQAVKVGDVLPATNI